jgi:hypothetical protein
MPVTASKKDDADQSPVSSGAAALIRQKYRAAGRRIAGAAAVSENVESINADVAKRLSEEISSAYVAAPPMGCQTKFGAVEMPETPAGAGTPIAVRNFHPSE